MTVTPQGLLYLCKTPLENDYKNQLTFSNETEQLNYFNSKIQYTFDNYTYIKKDNVVNVGENIDKLIECNYLFYKNVGFTNKWYYCFITNMEYVNENCTRITFETDCFQTWYFQIKYNRCFIEREHVNDDIAGLHTVPENLETGEYISNGAEQVINDFQIWGYVVNVTSSASGETYAPTIIGGVAMAGALFGFHGSNEILDFINFISSYDKRPEAIVNVYIVPYKLIEGEYDSDHQITNINYKRFTKSISKPTSIDGYTPINKKLLTYPYQYLILTNNNGSSNILHYEKFTSPTADFRITGLPTTGGSIKCRPLNYKGAEEEEGLIAGKYPTCSWSNDMFINWLTQNGVNIGLGAISNVASIIGGITTSNYTGITSGLGGIFNSLGQIYQHSFTPPSAKGNTNGGDIITSEGLNTFIFYPMSIKVEYARIIDNYFSMFGYKINRVKTPNITGRRNWNYVKTIECNFDGDIPQTDLNIIKAMFNNGVTLWHNPNTIYDYSNNNDQL